MTSVSLIEARTIREEQALDRRIDEIFELYFSEADTVGPHAREKLRAILKHYAKDPHPFRACVKDNMKRFGPGHTEKVCAVLKDMIRGTTHWRHHEDGIAASDFDLSEAERRAILVTLTDDDFAAIEEAIHAG